MEKSRVKIEASYTMATLGEYTPYAKLTSVKWQGRDWAVEEIVVRPTSWSSIRSDDPKHFMLHSQYGAYVLSNGDEYTLAIISGYATDKRAVSFYVDYTTQDKDKMAERIHELKEAEFARMGFAPDVLEDLYRNPDKYMDKG